MVKSSLVDVVAQVASSLVGRGCYFCLQLYLARTLGPQAFGVFALGLTIFTLMSGIAPFGMPQAVIRFGFGGRSVLKSTPLALAGLIGTFGLLLIAAFAPALGAVFKESQSTFVMLAMAPSIFLLSVFGVLCSALRAAGRNVSSAVVDALFFVLYLVLTLIFFRSASARSPETVAWSYDVALAIATAVAFALCWRVADSGATVATRSLVSFGFVTMIIHAVSMLNLQIDRLVIGIYAGGREVGLYQAATQIAMVAIVFRVAVLRVFEARIPKSDRASRTELTREFVASSRILMHISAPGLICVALSGAIWTKLLFGAPYVGAAAPLAVLVIGQLIQSLTGPSITALHMTGEERTAMAITIGSFAVNTLGNLLLFPRLGLIGSALATALASVALGFASFFRLRANGRLAPVSRAMSDVVIGTCVAALPPIAAVVFDFSSIPSMMLVAALSYAAYGATVMLLKTVEDEAFDLAARKAREVLGGLRKKKMDVCSEARH